ncbi:hypothetical protein BDW72DRAFT_208798 [Aspergillus terricola var. indicus]
MPSPLQADVYVSSRLKMAIFRLGEPSSFSHITCTLIHGTSEAVLIKSTAPGRTLKYVYITHGHGDHCFGIPTLRKHWPELRALTTPGTVAHMTEQPKPEDLEGLWMALFPNRQIVQPPDLTLPEPMDSDVFELEGNKFHIVEVGHTDTYNTTVLHVPSRLRLVIAGDAVYGDMHQYFGEANTALNPHTVIAGHKRAGTVDGVFNVHQTRQYILDFEDVVGKAESWMEVVEELKRRYPNRINPHAILRGDGCVSGAG